MNEDRDEHEIPGILHPELMSLYFHLTFKSDEVNTALRVTISFKQSYCQLERQLNINQKNHFYRRLSFFLYFYSILFYDFLNYSIFGQVALL